MLKYGFAVICMMGMLFCRVHAVEKSKEVPPPSLNGVITGIELSTLFDDPETYLTAGYVHKWFLIDIGANFERLNHANKNIGAFLGHLGMRAEIKENIYFTFGALGAGEAARKTPSRNWTIGAFAGLDLHIGSHFLITGKIYPYNYQETWQGNTGQYVFMNGTLGLFYLF